MKCLLVIWMIINVIFPVSVLLIFSIVDLGPPHQSWAVYLTASVMFIANAVSMTRHKTHRWPFAVMLLLNPFALIMLGAISFVTAIPDLLVLALL